MILSGDFYQLPPVPDINYGDNGQMCYNSLYVKKILSPCAIGYDPQTGGARLHRGITPDCRVISIKSRANNYRLLRFPPF